MEHIRIDTDSKFTEISGSFIGVQQCIDPDIVVGVCLYDLPVLDAEDDIVIGEALLQGNGVIGNYAVDPEFFTGAV